MCFMKWNLFSSSFFSWFPILLSIEKFTRRTFALYEKKVREYPAREESKHFGRHRKIHQINRRDDRKQVRNSKPTRVMFALNASGVLARRNASSAVSSKSSRRAATRAMPMAKMVVRLNVAIFIFLWMMMMMMDFHHHHHHHHHRPFRRNRVWTQTRGKNWRFTRKFSLFYIFSPQKRRSKRRKWRPWPRPRSVSRNRRLPHNRKKLLVTWRVSMAESPSSSCLRRSSGGSRTTSWARVWTNSKICKRKTREEEGSPPVWRGCLRRR